MKKAKLRFSVDELEALGTYIKDSKSDSLMKTFLEFNKAGIAFHEIVMGGILPGHVKYNNAEKSLEEKASAMRRELRKRDVIFKTSIEGFTDPVGLAGKIYLFITQYCY